MVNRRIERRRMNEETRRQAIAQKQAQIEKLQSEMEEMSI